MNTIIQEMHDQINDLPDADTADTAELSLSTLEQSNVQLFALNESILLSVIALPYTHTTTYQTLEQTNGDRFSLSGRLLPLEPLGLDYHQDTACNTTRARSSNQCTGISGK